MKKQQTPRKPREKRDQGGGATLTAAPQWLYQALCGGGPTASGIAVSEATALNLSVVWACVRAVSETIASLPWLTYQREADGGKQQLDNHEIAPLLRDAPNPEMSAFTWKETTVAHAMLWGNAYSEIVRSGKSDRIIALYPITPDRVTPRRLPTGQIAYDVHIDGREPRTLDYPDVYHVPGLGFDGIVGYSVVHKARESMGLAAATERFGAAFFGNGAHAGGVLKHPKTLSDKAAKHLRESWEALHRGAERSHKPALLEEGMDWQQMSVPPNDSQFLETRQFQVEEICRWFRVPPHKVQHLLRSTFSNIEHQSIEFVVDTVRPWLVRMEQQADRKLIRPSERGRVYTHNLVDALLRGDAQSRSAANEIQFRNGALSIDDWRAIENRNPLPDGQGKKYFVPLNMVPTDRLDEYLSAQIKKFSAGGNAGNDAGGSAGAAGPGATAARDLIELHLAGVRNARGDEAAAAESRRLAKFLKDHFDA
jgi:HK97 family phage portal protein